MLIVSGNEVEQTRCSQELLKKCFFVRIAIFREKNLEYGVSNVMRRRQRNDVHALRTPGEYITIKNENCD